MLDATYRELSEDDLRFLTAMLEDEGASRVSDIAHRLGVSSGYAAQYKRRLLEQGVIGERGRGIVDFDIPFFREYLEGMEKSD
ncbi:winged helix-turn-helix domain-containing protein [Collinsella ihumii]|uniref:Winged helix-turn-helix domain-containing protein n=1 Tax=Collinsella ihumii TaxID=1720204 RepID=A0AAW7JT44_9ACTN|nr:winged helix-turn-helix domain-containing protein [Collinsella ihumii]MDN0069557.1 winged helix-turn-helix domain-containing protein [Collinsella ihumii]